MNAIDNSKRTFEVVLYDCNQILCNSLFGSNAVEFMLANKTDAAFALLSQNEEIAIPSYIQKGIEWIRK